MPSPRRAEPTCGIPAEHPSVGAPLYFHYEKSDERPQGGEGTLGGTQVSPMAHRGAARKKVYYTSCFQRSTSPGFTPTSTSTSLMNEPGPTPAFFAMLKSVSGRLSQFIILTGKELGRMGRWSALQERDVVASDQGVSWIRFLEGT